jgi:hypothetical protein
VFHDHSARSIEGTYYSPRITYAGIGASRIDASEIPDNRAAESRRKLNRQNQRHVELRRGVAEFLIERHN